MSVLLDTHFWIWWLTGQPELTDSERTALGVAAESGEVMLSAISLWEAQMLHARGRLRLGIPFDTWLVHAAAPSVVRVLPLDVAVILALEKFRRRSTAIPQIASSWPPLACMTCHSLPVIVPSAGRGSHVRGRHEREREVAGSWC